MMTNPAIAESIPAEFTYHHRRWLLSIMLVILMGLTVSLTASMLLFFGPERPFSQVLVQTSIGLIIAFGVAWLFNRAGLFHVAAVLALNAILAAVLIVIVEDFSPEDIHDGLIYVVIPILMCSLLYPIRTTLIFAIVSITLLFTVLYFVPQAAFADVYFAAQFVTIVTIFILFVSYLRQRLIDNWNIAALESQKALGQQNVYLQVLHETSIALMGRQKLNDLLHVILERAAQLTETQHGNVYLVSADDQQIEPRILMGVYQTAPARPLQKGEGFVGKIWETGEPLVLEDYDAWAQRLPDFGQNLVHASIGVPLILEGRVLGTLSLSYIEAGRQFSQDQVTILGRFAQLAAIALDNNQLYSAVQKELTERQRSEANLQRQNDYLSALHKTAIALTSRLKLSELLQDILERAARLVDADHGSIQIMDPTLERMRVGAAIGVLKDVVSDREARKGIGLAGKVWETGQVVRVDDYQTWLDKVSAFPGEYLRAAVGVPLKIGSTVTGVLNLGHQDTARRFTDEEVELLTRFAELAAIALDNAYLYLALQQELTERLRAEVSLSNSESYYRALIENTSDIITLLNSNGIILDESPSVRRILGYDRMERIGRSIFDYVDATDMEAFLPEFLDVTQSSKMTTVLYRGRHKDGRQRSLEATITNLMDNPAVKAMILTSRDITDRRQALEELQTSEERFRQLTENIREVFWMTSANYEEVLYLSPAFEVTWGRRREDVYDWPRAHIQDILPEYRFQLGRMLAHSKRGEATDIEIQIRRPSDGSVRWLWSRTFPVQDSQGHFYRIAGVLEDITERKQVQVRLMNLLESEREQRIFAEALRESANAISTAATQSEVLNRILEHLARVVPHDGANILLFDPTTGFGNVVSQHGYSGEFGYSTSSREKGINISEIPLLRQIKETRQPQVLPDTREDPRWVVGENEQWIRSWIGVPIVRSDAVIGFVNLDSATPGFFSHHYLDRLVAFAGQLGITLENARLFELEREQRIFAEALSATTTAINSALTFDEVLAQVLANLDRVLQYDAANIMLLNHDKSIATIAKYIGYESPKQQRFVTNVVLEVASTPSLQQMISTGRPLAIPFTKEYANWIYVPESDWIHSTVAAPILRENEVIGFLHLDSTQAGFFSQSDAEHLQAFANQIGVALENARLFEMERDQRIFAEALRDAMGAIGRTLELKEVLEEIWRNIIRVVPHDAANIMLIDPNGITVSIVSAYGYSDAEMDYMDTSRVRFGEIDHLREMFNTGLPKVVPDVATLESWFADPRLTWIQSYASTPIRRENQIFGFLNLDSRTVGFFENIDIGRLVAFADQVGIAIYNAQLYDSERQQKLLAETLRDIGIVLTGSLHQQDILPKILEQIARVIPYDSAGVWMKQDDETWRLSVGVGYDRFGVEQEAHTLVFRAETSDIIRVMTTNPQVFIFPCLPYEQDDLQIVAFDWIRSWVVVPILGMGEVIGYFSLDHAEPYFFGPHNRPVLESLGNQISIVMENARLLERVEQQAAILEERVVDRTLELQRERAQLQAILDEMGEGVIYSEYQRTSERSQVQFVNNAFCELTGFTIPELADRPIGLLIEEIFGSDGVQQLIPTRGKEGSHLELGPRGRVTERSQLTVQRRDGSQISVAVTSTASGLQDTPLHWQLMLVRDISQEKALEAQKSRFVANASHELRTPLANLRTRLYLLRRQPEKLDVHIDVVERTTERMISLVEDLLNVSRFERGIIPFEPADTDLVQLVIEVIEDLQIEANRKSIQITHDLPPKSLHLFLDAKRIHQVITNVVVNAISYTPDHGAITVRITLQELGVLIAVQDTGPGIAPEQLEHVFDPFFRASEGKVSGTGLGLTIAKDIIERHRGKIWAESKLGQGSVFKILLPMLAGGT